MIKVKNLVRSFKNALRGAVLVFKSEQNFRIQVLVASIVILCGFILGIRATEFIVVLLLISVILGLELINSVLERIVDTFKPRIHPVVRDIKDIMAATVLLASGAAAIIGLIIFLPKLSGLF